MYKFYQMFKFTCKIEIIIHFRDCPLFYHVNYYSCFSLSSRFQYKLDFNNNIRYFNSKIVIIDIGLCIYCTFIYVNT